MKWKTDTDKAPPKVSLVEPSVKQRDSKGKFLRGNTPINLQDKTTGKFTTKLKCHHVTPSEDQHEVTVAEVDKLLAEVKHLEQKHQG